MTSRLVENIAAVLSPCRLPGQRVDEMARSRRVSALAGAHDRYEAEVGAQRTKVVKTVDDVASLLRAHGHDVKVAHGDGGSVVKVASAAHDMGAHALHGHIESILGSAGITARSVDRDHVKVDHGTHTDATIKYPQV